MPRTLVLRRPLPCIYCAHAPCYLHTQMYTPCTNDSDCGGDLVCAPSDLCHTYTCANLTVTAARCTQPGICAPRDKVGFGW